MKIKKQRFKYRKVPCKDCLCIPVCKNILLLTIPPRLQISKHKTYQTIHLLNKCDIILDHVFSKDTYHLNKRRLYNVLEYLLTELNINEYFIDTLYVHSYLMNPYRLK